MQLTHTILLTLSAAALSVARPSTVGDISSPAIPADFGPATIDFDGNELSANNTKLEKRYFNPKQIIHYCQHANGGGGCANQQYELFRCHNLASWWNDRISSAYVNVRMRCYLYAEKGCRGRWASVTHPGVGDLKKAGLNDQASSFFCEWSGGK